MKMFEHNENFYVTCESGNEFEVLIDYDFTPAQKADMTDPAFDAEFIVTSVRLNDNDFPLQLEWIENLSEFENEMAGNKRRRF